MVIQLIVNLILIPLNGIISMLPTISLDINTSWLDTIGSILQSAAYFLPISALLPILVITFSLETFNIAWKIIMRIKSFIPTMGA